jgi:predicted DNA-binding transcriptional regulator YafY
MSICSFSIIRGNRMGKNQLERILEIDRILHDRGSCSKEELSARFEISEKSVERDFSYMRDRLAAPLSYDRFKNLYVYSDSSYFLPAISMSEGEVMEPTELFSIIRENIGDLEGLYN